MVFLIAAGRDVREGMERLVRPRASTVCGICGSRILTVGGTEEAREEDGEDWFDAGKTAAYDPDIHFHDHYYVDDRCSP